MLLWRIYVVGNNRTYLGLRVKCPIFWPDVTRFVIYRQAFIKFPNIKFRGYPSSGTGADTCGQTYMTKLRGDFTAMRTRLKLEVPQVKGKVQPRTGHEGPEGDLRYNSTLSLTSAPDGGWWSTSLPGRFTPYKDPVPIV